MKRKPEAPLAWIGYIRVSTKEQKSSGLSLESQEAKVRAMATVKETTLCDIIVDAAESAKSLDRPGVQRLMEMIRRREIAGVIIAKLDRLTRSVRDLAALIELLQKCDCSLISCAETLDTSTASGRMILNITVTIAQWEREIICERTSDALQAKLKRGEAAGNVPYGWKSTGKDAQMVPDPIELGLIDMMRLMRKSGHSYAFIAGHLNAGGHKTRRGTPWRLQYVASILENNSEVAS